MKNGFQSYINEVSQLFESCGILTKEEEKVLGKRIQSGDKEAINQLVESNLKLVFYVAKKYVTQSSPMEELVSEGNIGLIRAAELFDPDRECKFSTYAYIWIERKILDYKAKSEFAGSKSNKSMYFKIMRLMNAYYLENGTHIEVSKVAEKLELSEEQVRTIFDQGHFRFSSMDMIDSNGESLNMEEILPDESIEPEEERIAKLDIANIASEMINRSKLDDREKFIVLSYFGIGEKERITLSDIGKILHISHSRVGQLYERAIRKLKYQAAKTGLNKTVLC